MVYFAISFCLGTLAVLQGGLNRQIAKDLGLSLAILLNSSILLFVALIFLFVCHRYPQVFPEGFAPRWSHQAWRWWYAIPAFCGFSLLTGIPALIPKLGAGGVFLCMMVGQMTFSLFWDLKIEELPLDPRRLIGLGLAFSGLIVAYWKSPVT